MGEAVPAWEHVVARPRKAVWCRSVSERDTVMRTILTLHKRRSPDARGLEHKQSHTSLVNDGGTVRFVFIQVGEAIRRFGAVAHFSAVQGLLVRPFSRPSTSSLIFVKVSFLFSSFHLYVPTVSGAAISPFLSVNSISSLVTL